MCSKWGGEGILRGVNGNVFYCNNFFYLNIHRIFFITPRISSLVTYLEFYLEYQFQFSAMKVAVLRCSSALNNLYRWYNIIISESNVILVQLANWAKDSVMWTYHARNSALNLILSCPMTLGFLSGCYAVLSCNLYCKMWSKASNVSFLGHREHEQPNPYSDYVMGWMSEESRSDCRQGKAFTSSLKHSDRPSPTQVPAQ